jgi:hypothetical protein
MRRTAIIAISVASPGKAIRKEGLTEETRLLTDILLTSDVRLRIVDQMPVLPKDALRLQPPGEVERFENQGEQAYRFCGLA